MKHPDWSGVRKCQQFVLIYSLFLAAMSSSRSDVLTQSIGSLIHHEGVFLLSKDLQCCFLEVYNGCFNEVSRILHASFMDKKFQGCFKKVSVVFQGCLMVFEEVLELFR